MFWYRPFDLTYFYTKNRFSKFYYGYFKNKSSPNYSIKTRSRVFDLRSAEKLFKILF